MSERIEQSLQQTGEVMRELVTEARGATSRRSFFARTASLAGATALGAAGVNLLQPIAVAAAATTGVTDTLQDIINIAATAEGLASTFYYNALISATLPDVNSVANRNYFQAAVVQEYEHLQLLRSLGATPLTNVFYFPENMFAQEAVFFPTASVLEDYFISAYLAAAIELSGAVSSGITTANPYALGFAVQVAGIECEHRALLRVAANLNPPNNRIIESALLTSVGAVATPLAPFLSGGAGFVGPFPVPHQSAINDVAQPYGFSSFPSFRIV